MKKKGQVNQVKPVLRRVHLQVGLLHGDALEVELVVGQVGVLPGGRQSDGLGGREEGLLLVDLPGRSLSRGDLRHVAVARLQLCQQVLVLPRHCYLGPRCGHRPAGSTVMRAGPRMIRGQG